GFFNKRFVAAFNQYKGNVGLAAYPCFPKRDPRVAIGPAEFKGFKDSVLAARFEAKFDHKFHFRLAPIGTTGCPVTLGRHAGPAAFTSSLARSAYFPKLSRNRPLSLHMKATGQAPRPVNLNHSRDASG